MTFNWLSLVTGFFYIVLGVFVLLKHWFFVELQPGAAYAFGAVMIAYGIFRIVRAIYRFREYKNEEN